MLTVKGLTKSYGEKVLFKDVSFSISRYEKVGLIGPNGAGKSTLFSLLLKREEPSWGIIHCAKDLKIGYLPQEAEFNSQAIVLKEILEGNERVLTLLKEKEELEAEGLSSSRRYAGVLEGLERLNYFNLEHQAKKILLGLGFKERDFYRSILELSGGFKMRILLALRL